MLQFVIQNDGFLLLPGEGQDEGVFMGNFMIPLTPSLSLRERESYRKYPEKLV